MHGDHGQGLVIFFDDITYTTWHLPYDENKHHFVDMFKWKKDLDLVSCNEFHCRNFLSAMLQFLQGPEKPPGVFEGLSPGIYVNSCTLDVICLHLLVKLAACDFFRIRIGRGSRIVSFQNANSLVDCFTNLELNKAVLCAFSLRNCNKLRELANVDHMYVGLQFGIKPELIEIPPVNTVAVERETVIIDDHLIYLAAVRASSLQTFTIMDHELNLEDIKVRVIAALEARPADSKPLELCIEPTQHRPLFSTGRSFCVSNRLLGMFNRNKLTRMDLSILDMEQSNLLESALTIISSSVYIRKIYLEVSPINDDRFFERLIEFLKGLTKFASRILHHPIELCAFLVRPSKGGWPKTRSDEYFAKIEQFKRVSKEISKLEQHKDLQILILLVSTKVNPSRSISDLQLLPIELFRLLREFFV